MPPLAPVTTASLFCHLSMSPVEHKVKPNTGLSFLLGVVRQLREGIICGTGDNWIIESVGLHLVFVSLSSLFQFTSFIMERWQQKVAIVTGASAGIGAACAKALAAAGLVVVGLARRDERVRKLAEELPKGARQNLHALKCDLTQEDEVMKAFDWTQRNLGEVDVLVNNAGVIETTQLSKRNNTREIRKTIETNLMGVVYCTREAFNSMLDRDVEGHIVIVNSVAGHQVPNLGPDLPSLNVYPATKFALRAMTEIYRQEFLRNKSKVRITSVSPGIVDTDILPTDIQTVVRQFAPMLKSDDVADAVLYAISTPQNVQVHNIIIKPMGEKF